MNKNSLVTAPCRRGCGRKLHTLSRSLYSIPKEIKEKYHLICNECMSRREKNEMLETMNYYVLGKIK